MKTNINRRSFLKGAAMTGAAALAGCANNDAALSETGSTPEWMPETWDYETDVLVIGYGGAGLWAGITAFDEGAQVLYLEKSPFRGGGSSSINMGQWTAPHDADAAAQFAFEAFHGQTPMEVCQAWAEEAVQNPDYADEYGLEYTLGDSPRAEYNIFTGYEEMYVGSGDGYGAGFFEAMDQHRADRGIEVLFECHDEELIQNPVTKEIVGCYTLMGTDETPKAVKASKGVILATGDYMNNEAMVKRWCPDVDGYDKKQYQKTGDGHIMAIDAGAKMENLGHTKMMHDFDSGLMYEEPFLYVNMEGKRFCNEDTGFVYMGNITKYLPRYNGANVDANHPDGSLGWYCQIYDSDYMSYANSPVPEQVMTKYIPGAVENPQGVFTNLIDTYKADTIEELAALLDVPADELQKTIDRYNELCDQGTDADFGKKSAYMHKIEKAPFWGVRKHIRVSSIDSGVNTNANGQALDADGKVIEGLYCVGNVGGVFYGGADYPFHQTGLSLGRCYTFGMLAAKHAMGK